MFILRDFSSFLNQNLSNILKKEILAIVWSAQHPIAGQNMQLATYWDYVAMISEYEVIISECALIILEYVVVISEYAVITLDYVVII